MGHSLNESAGTKEVNGFFSANQYPQEDVESDEMVDVGRVRWPERTRFSCYG
jgi:hypothetical protein